MKRVRTGCRRLRAAFGRGKVLTDGVSDLLKSDRQIITDGSSLCLYRTDVEIGEQFGPRYRDVHDKISAYPRKNRIRQALWEYDNIKSLYLLDA